MYTIIIKTCEFVEKFLKYDLKKNNIKKIDKETFEIEINDETQLENFITHCLYFSRLIKKIYLKDENNLIDLFEFDLSKRDYKLNISNKNNTLNPILINYCLYQLGLDEEEDFTIIDPLANLGEIIIETSIFATNKPLNLQKRTKTPYSKLYNKIIKLPKQNKTKNKFLAFVQDNIIFKKLKENIDYAGVKIKCSKYELDWLDIKFKEAQIDFAITQITRENEDKIDELLYMLAFIISDAICLISHKKIDNKLIKKYELEIELEEKIEIENNEFYIIILN